MGRSYLSFSFVRLNCNLLCSCEVCFFWFFSGNKDVGTEGTRELGRTPWVDRYDLLPIVPAAIGSLFVFATSFWYTSNSLYQYVSCACSVSVGCCLGSTRFHVLFFTAVGSCTFVFSGFIRSFYLAHLFYYLWYQVYHHLSIYRHWYPPI
jgi:hypothetical protein